MGSLLKRSRRIEAHAELVPLDTRRMNTPQRVYTNHVIRCIQVYVAREAHLERIGLIVNLLGFSGSAYRRERKQAAR